MKLSPLRVSLLLAAAGLVLFWGTFFAIVAFTPGYRPSNGLWMGRAFRGALIAHLVGIGLVFAVPRGQRTLPVKANAIPLAIMLVLLVLFFALKGW